MSDFTMNDAFVLANEIGNYPIICLSKTGNAIDYDLATILFDSARTMFKNGVYGMDMAGYNFEGIISSDLKSVNNFNGAVRFEATIQAEQDGPSLSKVVDLVSGGYVEVDFLVNLEQLNNGNGFIETFDTMYIE